MTLHTQTDIEKLQNSLALIRHSGGWTAEEFGDMIGVTKQTISNLETKKSKLTKTQYIAIRAVLDYEISKHPENSLLSSTVNLCLNSNEISAEDLKKAQAFVTGAKRANLDRKAVIAGLCTLLGVTAMAETLLVAPAVIGAGAWLAKIMKDK